MKVVAVVQRKGGVGKTTLSVNLAGELARRKKAVTVIDADPQASALAWATPRKLDFEVRQELFGYDSLPTWMKTVLRTGADFVIIDTPADLGSVFKIAVEISDLIVVPCGPSSLDINSARQTIAKIADVTRKLKGDAPKVALVPTRVDPSTMEGQQIAEELAELGEAVAPPLSYDVTFVRAFAAGKSISVFSPGSQADGEVRSIIDFLLKQLDGEHRNNALLRIVPATRRHPH